MANGSHLQYLKAIGIFVKASTGLEFLMAFLVVVPLTLWLALTSKSGAAESVVLALFCMSFAWLNVSILKFQRGIRRLGNGSSVRLLMSPRPEDPDELMAWRWGRNFCYSFLAVVVSMGGFAFVLWIRGE